MKVWMVGNTPFSNSIQYYTQKRNGMFFNADRT